MATPLNPPRPTLLALAVTALMIAPLAHADGTAESSARTLDTAKVTADGEIPDSSTVKGARSATRLDLSLRETPQSVTVVARQNNVGFHNGVYWGEPRRVTMTLHWKP
ncbi:MULTISPECIES: hypothetical protein [Stenotrophomonas]|uniref:TonB-dependent receptor n=1 Tax=Stenotrophomonas maltophilia TaxID=40324 RepID=A0A2J0UFM0_STEMA|nr:MULTISPECIES: hypothetical protein [Stenotrophomonas]PJL33657.1 hypothetical protein B9Y64_00770 [Stenotrophomonas maltophilia]